MKLWLGYSNSDVLSFYLCFCLALGLRLIEYYIRVCLQIFRTGGCVGRSPKWDWEKSAKVSQCVLRKQTKPWPWQVSSLSKFVYFCCAWGRDNLSRVSHLQHAQCSTKSCVTLQVRASDDALAAVNQTLLAAILAKYRVESLKSGDREKLRTGVI